ncbi:hypothetical protein [Nocardia transvalensis]|uniref:hypothetical protein n=1 Tax=Nocardia transvalensis TaxID=37333 RepID=UPI001895AC2D|nr:hypothetical protein [Nocardia transvalensis]MBF6334240.1 hypothetical protein [Nocardia transvalensis]
MKSGFVIEEHVVIYCDICGDHYCENNNESICFDSVAQAIAYITHRGAGIGWAYDGDRVLCDGCMATATCREHGHLFPDTWRTTAWPLGTKSRSRACDRCGIPEIEALP